jgi:hypothetical protein
VTLTPGSQTWALWDPSPITGRAHFSSRTWPTWSGGWLMTDTPPGVRVGRSRGGRCDDCLPPPFRLLITTRSEGIRRPGSTGQSQEWLLSQVSSRQDICKSLITQPAFGLSYEVRYPRGRRLTPLSSEQDGRDCENEKNTQGQQQGPIARRSRRHRNVRYVLDLRNPHRYANLN